MNVEKLVRGAGLFVVLFGWNGLARADFIYSTTSVYDENVLNPNAVDTVATTSNNVGGLVGFTARVAAAHAINRGGVVNFDNPLSDPASVAGNTFSATYGVGATNTLVVSRTDGLGIPAQVNRNNDNVQVLSGDPGVANNDYYMGFAADSNYTLAFSIPLKEFGLTQVWRNAARQGRLTVNLTAGAPVVFADEFIANAQDDTFFGYEAPAGIGIASITYSSLTAAGGLTTSPDTTQFARWDDFGFIVVPEPTTMLLGALGLIGFVRRRRKTVA